MGVDYIGHYGIGIGIESIDFDDEGLDQEIQEFRYMGDLLDERLNTKKYKWFEVGDGNYTGGSNDYYVAIKEPFKNGFNNLKKEKSRLLKHLREIGLTPVGKFGAIGGLEIH